VTPYPSQALVEPQPVEFKSADGTLIHGQLFLPRTGNGTRHPALIYMHGGPIRQTLLGWHYLGYYHYGYAMNQFMASRGYVTLSVNYRCGIGYGRAFRHNMKCGPLGATEYQDIVAAGQYLQSRADVDAKKIGLWGGSYGGYLTAMGLARDSKMFAAGVDFHGVHDWVRQVRNLQQISSPQQRDASLNEALASSPMTSLQEWTSPVLLIHGDDDPTVDFVQTTELVHQLRDTKRVHVEDLVFPGEGHFFLRHETWLRAFQATSDFFDKFLRAPMQATR
jgi:dipeptidyl aminopeptidase/acylaminoacyl peptidase